MCIIVIPAIKICKENKRCVYEIIFPDKSYYIGSTTDIFKRISGYKSAFNNSIGSVNKKLAAKYNEFGTYEIIILDVIPDDVDPKIKEHEYLIRQYDKEKDVFHEMLNRSRSAFNNTGMIKKDVV